MPNLILGYKASKASASRCADECQNAYLPFSSLQVCSTKVAFSCIGLLASQCSPLTVADKTFLASPSLMDSATSIAEDPCSTCLTVPSGNVISIIAYTYLDVKVTDIIWYRIVICKLRAPE